MQARRAENPWATNRSTTAVFLLGEHRLRSVIQRAGSFDDDQFVLELADSLTGGDEIAGVRTWYPLLHPGIHKCLVLPSVERAPGRCRAPRKSKRRFNPVAGGY